MKTRFVLVLSFILLWSLVSVGTANAGVRAGMVFDAADSSNAAIREACITEVTELLGNSHGVTFSDTRIVTADGSLGGVREALARQLKAKDVDVVVALGPLSVLAASKVKSCGKPLFAVTDTTDLEILGLSAGSKGSGIANVSCSGPSGSFVRDMKVWAEMSGLQRAAIVVRAEMLEAAPGMAEALVSGARASGLEASVVPFKGSAADVVGALPDEVKAVVAGPGLWLSEEEQITFADALRNRKLASFTVAGPEAVRRGFMATNTPDDEGKRVARRVALCMRRALQGEKPESIGVEFPRSEGICVNIAAARSVGLSLPYATLLDAEIVNADPDQGNGVQTWTFQSAVEEGVKANLELAASDKGVLAGQQTIREAFAILLPKLEASTLAVAIDEDRAATSMGQHAEYTWSASLALTQVLYSELAWANIDIQKALQKGREAARERLRLDITQETAKTYINYLRARVLEKVHTDYLRRVRGHLETAKVRQAAGVANPSEVYRWENEVANSRRNLTDAQAKRGMAQAALNRLLHRPQEEPFIAQTITTADSPFTSPDAPIEACLNTPERFEALRDFLVAEGLDRAPELKQYEAGITAQERGVLATKRSFYTPTVGMQAEVREDFWEDGPGKEGPAFPVGLLVEAPDNHNWNVGVKASVPVYAGGGRSATKKRLQLQVEQLQLEREATREKLELRIRAAAQAARASRQSIGETAKSLEAAQKTLELVSDGYARGLLSIVELLDAQTQALIAEQLNANAMYTFMLDLMDLQRAVACFEFSMSAEEQSAWQRRLEDFMAKRNAPVEMPAGPITQGR